MVPPPLLAPLRLAARALSTSAPLPPPQPPPPLPPAPPPPPSDAALAPVSASRAGIGAFASMCVLSWPLALALPGADGALLFASFGSSACVLPVAPASPFARPRAVVVGHCVSSAAGAAAAAAAAALGAAPALAAPAAVALAVGAMVATRSEHPPAAGTAIITSLSPLGLHVIAPFVAVQAVMLVVSYALAARLLGGGAGAGRAYPASWTR